MSICFWHYPYRHRTIARLLHPTVLFRIELGEFVTTGIGPRRELNEKREKKDSKFLLINVPELDAYCISISI